MDFNEKVFVMVGTLFTRKDIGKMFFGIFLNNFLQSRFVIFEGFRLGIFDFRFHEGEDKFSCLFHAAVEIDGGNNCFKSVCKNRGTFITFEIMFTTAEFEIFSDIKGFGKAAKAFFTYKRGSEFGEFAFGEIRAIFVYIIGNDYAQNSVTQKFKSFIAFCAVFDLVCIRGMSQGIFKIGYIFISISYLFFKFFHCSDSPFFFIAVIFCSILPITSVCVKSMTDFMAVTTASALALP